MSISTHVAHLGELRVRWISNVVLAAIGSADSGPLRKHGVDQRTEQYPFARPNRRTRNALVGCKFDGPFAMIGP